MRAGDHAADALGLVPVVLPNRASASLSSGSQSNGVAGNTRMDIFGSTHHTVIVFAPTLDVPIIQSELTTLDRSLRKASVRPVVVHPGSTSMRRVMRTEGM